MAHESEKNLSVLVLCIDYRFWPKALPLLEKKYGKFDLIGMAGASKNILSPLHSENRETLIKNIETSVKLHHPQKIILTNHTDCGAYGGSGKFKSCEEEIAFHREELQKAKSAIQEKFKELKTECVIIDRDKTGKVKILEI